MLGSSVVSSTISIDGDFDPLTTAGFCAGALHDWHGATNQVSAQLASGALALLFQVSPTQVFQLFGQELSVHSVAIDIANALSLVAE